MGEQQGHDFSTPVIIEGYPRQERVNGIWANIEKWRIHVDHLEDYLPANNESDEEGRIPGKVTVVPVPAFSGVVEVSFPWKKPETVSLGSIDRPEGSVIFESEAVLTEKNPESHPDWDGADAATQEKIKKNVASFSFVTVTFKRSEIKNKSSFEFTESELLGNVNLKENPTGLTNPTANKWMNMGKTIHWEMGENLEVIETWRYDQNEWEGMITSAPGDLNKFIAKVK